MYPILQMLLFYLLIIVVTMRVILWATRTEIGKIAFWVIPAISLGVTVVADQFIYNIKWRVDVIAVGVLVSSLFTIPYVIIIRVRNRGKNLPIKQRVLPLLSVLAFFILLVPVGFYIYVKRLYSSVSYFQTVGEYVQQGKLDDAIAILKDTLSKNQRIAEAHAALGMIYNKKDMLDEALSELKIALNIDPELITIYQEMYLVYKKKGMEEEAQKALDSYEKLKGSK